MHFSAVLIAAVAGFLPLASSHMVMIDPIPFGQIKENAPLDPSGSNFPCKVATGAIPQESIKIYTPGTASSFKLMGGATHGGGSCQISITYDNPPTKNSVFKVVQSYHGACPDAFNGNAGTSAVDDRAPIPVTLPEGLKAGDAVFVWSWFNKIGNREMYMNCAPIKIAGSSTSDEVFNSLPDMFVANINAPGNACTTKETFDIIFPNPGKNVVTGPGNFAPACEGGPVPAPTGPALVGGGDVTQSSVVIGTTFTKIGAPSSEAPVAPAPTTLVTISSAPVAVPTSEVQVVVPTTEVPVVIQPTKTAPVVAPTPTGGAGNGTGNGNGGGSGNFVIGKCDSTKQLIICHPDPTKYSQCYSDNLEYGVFAVPPGTECDSTGLGGFKAKSAVNSRFVRRSLRGHARRGFLHRHLSH